MSVFDAIISLPILVGIILLLLPRSLQYAKATLSILVSAVTFYYAFLLYFGNTQLGWTLPVSVNPEILEFFQNAWIIDPLNKLIVLFIAFFGVGVLLYSTLHISSERYLKHYYAFFLMTLGASMGAAVANNLLIFLTFWSLLALTLYKLIPSKDEESSNAALKSIVIIGTSDVLMLVGIGIVWKLQGTLSMSELSVGTETALPIIAFVCLLIGAFTKAGAFPFHSWIPDFTQSAPAPSSAFLPASLDKLLGIYFMARLCNEMFVLNQWLTFIIILIGALTIIIGVMMALIQHNYKKLLGFHAVSQVGYMIVGLGMGTILGIVGGLFHMINNALYKSGLFLVAGNVEAKTGQSKIEKLGGLSVNMPVTFITAIVFALAISGIPPFNGFTSKWIIYQAIIEFGQGSGIANNLWIVWLVLAVIGSALTLASFIKFITGIFMGRRLDAFQNVKESNVLMQIPMITMALLCIIFGVFATNYVVPFLFEDIVGVTSYVGTWDSTIISSLIIVSVAVGIAIYAIGNMRNMRVEDSFIGGENIQENTGFEVSNFYNTVREFKPLDSIYDKAEHHKFDLFHVSRDGVLRFTDILKRVHSGILHTYTIWFVAGLIIMILILLLI